MAQVQILSREAVPDPADPEGVQPALRVTYSTNTRGPRTLFVPGEKLTEEQIAEAIRQDLAAREGAPPSLLEL